VKVEETFFAVVVRDMARATAFYSRVFDASITHASPAWTSLHVAGVRLGLSLVGDGRSGEGDADDGHGPEHTGLHFAMRDLDEVCAEVERAGGSVARPPFEVVPGIVLALVRDTEDNGLTLTKR
jgi:predicted enzyme related to lactoylglutathione lyase